MITSNQVKDFWSFMMKEFGAKVEQKNDAMLMKVAAEFLESLHIQSKDDFMKHFVTTIGKTIYIPFVIGDLGLDDRWPLWNQVRVCVHECQHVVQGEREGWAAFGSKYLTSSSYRAGYEAEAFGCDMEMEFWKQGNTGFNAGAFAEERPYVLKSYGCTTEDIDMVKEILSIRAGIVSQGVVENMASVKAITWLGQYVPELQNM